MSKKAIETLDDLRSAVREHREQGKQIISHFKRMEKEYSDWEDRLTEIENHVAQAELDTGLTKEEIINPPSILEDIFGDDLISGVD